MTPPLRHRDLARFAVDLIATIEPSGRVAWVSPSAWTLVGREAETLVGADVRDWTHPDDRAELAATLAELVATPDGTARATHRCRHADGSWRLFETVARNLMHEPRVRAILVQSRDVTSAAQLEAMIEESRDAAYELAMVRADLIDRLHQLDESKARLSAMLVHDLKSPLTSILLTSGHLREDAADPEQICEHASTVRRAADAMHRMVLDLLDIGQSEDGALIPKLAEVDLREVVELAVTQSEPMLGARKQIVTCELGVGLRATVDRELLVRVIQNLIDNCAKYAPRESAITIAATEREDGQVELAISDRGPGVPDDYKLRIFELYTRIERDVQREARTSRGVGLAFCKLVLEAHGGGISVDDNPGGGSVFRCRWPRTPR